MLEVVTGLFDTTGFPPRKQCGTGWTPSLIWMHVTSDLFIWLAYLSIPLVLLYFTRRRDLPFPRLFVLFALFILACGTTHFLDALIFEYPVYRLAGVMKLVTAVVSWATVIALVPVIPRVMQAMTTAAGPGAVTRQHRALTDADAAPRESRVQAYIVALLAGVLAVLVRAAIDPLVSDDDVFVLALLAVVYVSWRHGFGPGAVCLCVSAGGYVYFFVPPRQTLYTEGFGNQLAVALFFFCGAACAALGEAQRQASRRARVMLATAVTRGEELEAEVARRRAAEVELVAAQRQTTAALARLNAFLDNAPLGIAFFDPELRYVRINTYLAASNGKPVEAHTGRALTEVLPDFPPEIADAYRRTAGPGGAPFATQMRRPARDGSGTRVWQLTAFPVPTPTGEVMGAGVIAQDVTEQKRAADELAEQARASSLRAEVAAALDVAGDTRAVLRECAETLARGTGAAFAGVWVTDASGEWLELRAGAGLPAGADGPRERVRVGESGVGRIVQSRTPYVTSDAAADPNVGDPGWAAREGLRAFVGYPLMVEGRVLGAVALFARRPLSGTAVTDLGPIVASIGLYLDRRRAAEELRESETRFRTLAQAVPHIVWVTRPDGYHEYYNDRWYQYTGLTEAQSIGYQWSGPLHPDDRARAEARWKLATDAGGEYEVEYRFRAADGRYRWFLGRALPQRGADGQIVRWYGTCTDIHDEKLAVEAVRRNEERFRLLTEAVPNVVWNADEAGGMTYFNRRWVELTGVPLARAGGRGWLAAVHPDDRARVLAAWQDTVGRATPGGADRFQHELRLKDAGDGYRWFQTVAVPLRHPDGRVDQWIGSMADIHDQKTAAEALRESEERFRSLADGTPAMVWVADADGRRTYFNRTWVEFTGRPAEEQLGYGWAESMHPDDRELYLGAYATALAGRRPFELEYRLRRYDGADRWVLARGVPRLTPAGGFAGFVGLCLDVTERKRAEADLQASEAFRKSVFENSPDCLKIIALDGRVLEMNEGGCRLMEIDDFGTVRGEQWPDLWPAIGRGPVGEAMEEARAGRVGRFQGFCPTAKGTPKYWDVSVAAVPSADGTPYRLIAVSRDITEQRRTEERVRESEELFRQLAESLPQLAWMTDPEGYIFWYNQRWYDYTGTTLEEMKGWGWEAVHDPAELPRVEAKWKAALAAGEPWEDTFPLRGADGKFRWHLSRARPMRDATGAVVRWFGTNTDISAQREMEQTVRASERRFRLLTEAVPQMVWTADPRGEITFFNRRWDEYTGSPVESRHGEWWAALLHPDDADAVRARWQLAVAQGSDSYSAEFRLRRAADGQYRWMLSVAVPLRGPAGEIAEWVGALTDIDDQKRQAHTLERMVRERTAELETANGLLTTEVDERKAAEERVRKVAAELERSNGELEKFAYVASHDLQEPLRKIQAFGDRLRTKCREQLPDTGKEYVDRMLVAAGRMRRLIDDLLTFSRVTTQRRPFVRLSLDKLVREVVSDLDVRITQAGGTVRVGALPTLDADPTQMRQLFQNLIANAVKFQRPGVPPVVEIGCTPVTLSAGGEPRPAFRLTVRDNGIGFDEKYTERIFDVFQRLHGRDEYEGTGVGLAICRKIAERHGGQITAHSQEGQGATFVVVVPATQSDTREATTDDD